MVSKDGISDLPQLSPVLFWDVEATDLKNDIVPIVERVIELGTLDDFRKVLAFYGKDTVKNILLQSTRLSPRDLHFCSVFFEVDKTKFACYTKKYSSPKPLRYWNP